MNRTIPKEGPNNAHLLQLSSETVQCLWFANSVAPVSIQGNCDFLLAIVMIWESARHTSNSHRELLRLRPHPMAPLPGGVLTIEGSGLG